MKIDGIILQHLILNLYLKWSSFNSFRSDFLDLRLIINIKWVIPVVQGTVTEVCRKY